MAETKVLKGINFPGLEGTYYVPEATAVEDENGYIEIKSYVSDTVEVENLDATLTREGYAADAAAVGNALQNKVSVVEGSRLMTQEEANKLAKLVIDEDGNVGSTDVVNVGNAEGILTITHGGTGNTTGYIQTGAQNGSSIGNKATIEGTNNIGSGESSHVEGASNTASGDYSHAEGVNSEAGGDYSHAEGVNTYTSGVASHAEGANSKATGGYSHAEGNFSQAKGECSHAEGQNTIASGESSHAEGLFTNAWGYASHAEGQGGNVIPTAVTSESTDDEIIAAWKNLISETQSAFTLAKGTTSHTEGTDALAIGNSSHAEGSETIASHFGTHAEGARTVASGYISHAEGYTTEASGYYSHAEGMGTVASKYASHAEGRNTLASSSDQHVQGRYNIEDTDDTYAHIVGNGSSTTRSNAHTLDWDGNAWFAGAIDCEDAVTTLDNLKALNLAHVPDGDTDHLIPENADLNDYVAPGVYRCATATIAKTLSNMASYTSAGFRLIVSGTSTGNGSIQIVIFNSSVGRLWFRIRTGVDTWGDWKRILTSDDTTGSGSSTDLSDLTAQVESKLEMHHIWSNASADSLFKAQTITISNLSDYDYLAVIAVYHVDNKRRLPLLLVPVTTTTGGQLLTMHGAGTSLITAYRELTKVTATTIVFGDCSYGGGVNQTATINNEYCVPYRIYGLKGVQ